MKRMFCVLTMLCVLASCVTVHAEENAATLDGTNGDVLYQVALIQSLVQGYYDGIITVGELKQHGDSGIYSPARHQRMLRSSAQQTDCV